MKQVQAWELLNNPDYCNRLTMGGYHDLLLRAGYKGKEAQKAASRHGWDRLCAGEML